MLDYLDLNPQKDNKNFLKSEQACLGLSIHGLLARIGERAAIKLFRNKGFLGRLYFNELSALASNSKYIAEKMLEDTFDDNPRVLSIWPQLISITYNQGLYSTATFFYDGLEKLRKEFNESSIDISQLDRRVHDDYLNPMPTRLQTLYETLTNMALQNVEFAEHIISHDTPSYLFQGRPLARLAAEHTSVAQKLLDYTNPLEYLSVDQLVAVGTKQSNVARFILDRQNRDKYLYPLLLKPTHYAKLAGAHEFFAEYVFETSPDIAEKFRSFDLNECAKGAFNAKRLLTPAFEKKLLELPRLAATSEVYAEYVFNIKPEIALGFGYWELAECAKAKFNRERLLASPFLERLGPLHYKELVLQDPASIKELSTNPDMVKKLGVHAFDIAQVNEGFALWLMAQHTVWETITPENLTKLAGAHFSIGLCVLSSAQAEKLQEWQICSIALKQPRLLCTIFSSPHLLDKLSGKSLEAIAIRHIGFAQRIFRDPDLVAKLSESELFQVQRTVELFSDIREHIAENFIVEAEVDAVADQFNEVLRFSSAKQSTAASMEIEDNKTSKDDELRLLGYRASQ